MFQNQMIRLILFKRIILAVTCILLTLLALALYHSSEKISIVRQPDIFSEQNPPLEPAPHLALADTYEERSARVRETCANSTRANSKTEPDRIHRLWDMSAQTGLIQCPTFKVSSTMWRNFFCKILRETGDISAGEERSNCQIQDVWRSVRSCGSFSSCRKNLESSISFMVVRDPFSRYLSAFRDRWELGIKYHTAFYRGKTRKFVQSHRNLGSHSESERDTLMNQAEKVMKSKDMLNKLDEIITSLHQHVAPTVEQISLITTSENPFLNPPGPTFAEVAEWHLDGGGDEHLDSMWWSCAPCHNNYRILKLENYPGEAFQLVEDSGHGEEWKWVINELLEGYTSSGISSKSEECMILYYRSLSPG